MSIAPATPGPGGVAGIVALLGRKTVILGGVALTGAAVTLGLRVAGASEVAIFVIAAVTLAGLAGLVGEGTDQLGGRFGPGATGVLQSALGNLPELFISLFALREGLTVLVQTALVGSILGNSLLVLGLAFLAGGLKHGRQVFDAAPVRTIAIVVVLAVASLAIPTVSTSPGGPDQGHAVEISVFVSIILLVVFVASIPYSLRGGQGASAIGHGDEGGATWPLRLSLGVLATGGIGAAFVSDWFVAALRPAMATLGLSEAFVGLVVVAIAGNAVENVVGIQQAMKNRMDLSISLIQNSSLQVAIALTPVLMLASLFISPTPMTLVLAPTLLVGLSLTAILGAFVVFDGESTWLEGLMLLGLYLIIAASVWYGPPVAL
ncbi:MAG: calcium/proton exchanger [Candidatus Limnocylindrales bacterium]